MFVPAFAVCAVLTRLATSEFCAEPCFGQLFLALDSGYGQGQDDRLDTAILLIARNPPLMAEFREFAKETRLLQIVPKVYETPENSNMAINAFGSVNSDGALVMGVFALVFGFGPGQLFSAETLSNLRELTWHFIRAAEFGAPSIYRYGRK